MSQTANRCSSAGHYSSPGSIHFIKPFFTLRQVYPNSMISFLWSEHQLGQPCGQLREKDHDGESDHLEKHKWNDAPVNIAG